MSRLAPNLFDRRFADLVEQGRSRLPSLAPDWTDHNAHDPGIMLMELLAWVAEAQIYSLARARRDERGAYAALMGRNSRGARPAQRGFARGGGEQTAERKPAFLRQLSLRNGHETAQPCFGSQKIVVTGIAPLLSYVVPDCQ